MEQRWATAMDDPNLGNVLTALEDCVVKKNSCSNKIHKNPIVCFLFSCWIACCLTGITKLTEMANFQKKMFVIATLIAKESLSGVDCSKWEYHSKKQEFRKYLSSENQNSNLDAILTKMLLTQPNEKCNTWSDIPVTRGELQSPWTVTKTTANTLSHRKKDCSWRNPIQTPAFTHLFR